MKYYFIYYLIESRSAIWHSTDVIDKHPFEWQKEKNEIEHEQFLIVNWKEITAQEYSNYKDVFETTSVAHRLP